MKFDVLTLFPAMIESPFADSILGKAVERGVIEIRGHNLRDWAEGRHQVTDDTPCGGGDGMVMKVEPVARALADLRQRTPGTRVLLMTPQGKRFTQKDASALSREAGLVFVCGRYEGFDERIRTLVDDEYSLGDFILTGGELAAMVMIDATESSAAPEAPSAIPSPTAFSNTPSTRGRWSLPACTSPMSSSRETTARSPAGVAVSS
jgi:tRNA (guanine37-N1)-methyltransferase